MIEKIWDSMTRNSWSSCRSVEGLAKEKDGGWVRGHWGYVRLYLMQMDKPLDLDRGQVPRKAVRSQYESQMFDHQLST